MEQKKNTTKTNDRTNNQTKEPNKMEDNTQTNDSIPSEVQDLFSDLGKLRSTPAGGESTIMEKKLTVVPVRKPSKECFFRVHPEHHLDASVLELKEEGDTLLITPNLLPHLVGEQCIVHKRLQLAITRQGVPFIWPLRHPKEGKRDAWAISAMDAALMGVSQWVRIQANMPLGAYEIAVAKVDVDPAWPTQSFNELMRIAFKGAIIDSLDHPALKQLRGEA
jgi:hypothetical protein